MRRAFFETLAEIGQNDSRVILLTADLGYLAIEAFADRLPQQFFNVGVSEQNMVGMATGLAEAGFIPFVYSINPFVVLRAYEFIRNGPIAQRLPVRIVSVGAGFDYGTNGISHYGIEDVGVLRVQPDLALLTPADTNQVQTALRATWEISRPVYYRLSKEELVIPQLEGRFQLGRTQTLREGADVLLVALGTSVSDTLEGAEMLAERGISAGVELVDNLNGYPLARLIETIGQYRLVVTVEAHYLTGGIGSYVCELVAEHGLHCKVERCGIASVPDGTTGSRVYLHRKFGIDALSIADRTEAALRGLR